MSNIAEKLRSTTEEMALRASVGMGLWDRHSNSCLDAAEEIDRLNAENARLREALRDIVEAWDWWQVDTYDRCQSVPSDAINEARAALAEQGEK